MKKTILLLLISFVTITSNAQIVINQNDMPDLNDSFVISKTNQTEVDYELTGEDYLWDFSSLVFDTQQNEIYLHPINTPFSYNLVFIYQIVSTIAKESEAPQLPQQAPITITESYDFFKETSSSFTKSGFAAKINDVPTPRKYDVPELYYTFPLSFGSPIDSSLSAFDIEIPGYGYYGQKIKRVNEVDGWGQITTPFGTFECIRLKSKVTISDTIFLVNINNGFSTTRPEQHEYKWLSNEQGIPILQINSASLSDEIIYLDSIRSDISNTNTLIKSSKIVVFPNPTTDKINVTFPEKTKGAVQVTICNNLGHIVRKIETDQLTQNSTLEIFLNDIPTGFYTIIISIGTDVFKSTFTKIR